MDRWQGCDRAPALAADLLGPRSGRFRHVAGVAAAAAAAGAAVPHGDLGLLVAAAWLHDIGYAAPAAGTGFHPLDGARFLRGIGAPDRLCRLVAHHTGARVEAAHRGLLDPLLEEFPAEASPAADALTYADLVTGPDGSPVAPADRLAEILVRYPPGHVVHASIRRARPQLLDVAARVEARLAAALPSPAAAL